MSRQVSITERQQSIMLDFMESHQDLLRGKFTSQFTSNIRTQYWVQLTEMLNADGLGPTKTEEKWMRLNDNEFRGLKSLQELYLGHNHIYEIPKGMLNQCTSLKKLFVFNNNMKNLENGVFNGLRNLTSLFLNNNLLRYIGNDVFEDIPNLQKLHLDSNKLHFLPGGSLDYITKILSVKLAKNPWHCDCSILYFARWLRANEGKVWDANPMCRGPGDLGGHLIQDMTFEDLCTGQWASMTKLTPRIPIN